jgi:hypothetical protein
VNVRLSLAERFALDRKAALVGLPVSSYVREVGLGRVVRARRRQADRAALRHRVRSSCRRLASAEVEELVRLGVQLNAFAHASNTAHRLVGVSELRELLAELRSTARDLSSALPE